LAFSAELPASEYPPTPGEKENEQADDAQCHSGDNHARLYMLL